MQGKPTNRKLQILAGIEREVCFTMKFQAIELYNGSCLSLDNPRKVFLLPFTLLLILIPLSIIGISHLSPPKTDVIDASTLKTTDVKSCDLFSGRWVLYPEGPYYTNETCHLIKDGQNCLKSGRPDKDFLKWRWKPDDCELPLFDAAQFLNLVRGKSMAFVGDSLGMNQMQSLMCLLSGVVANPEDITLRYTSEEKSRVWFYADYNFTLGIFWSPYLVRANEIDLNGHSFNSLMNLNLDEADKEWANQVENFDYVIISAGQWFFHKMVFNENGQAVGCFRCELRNITNLTNNYGLRKVFRTAFRTLMNLKGYKGMTFLRTFSPIHFENGTWNQGGSCGRTRPYVKEEKKVDDYLIEAKLVQVEEFRAAEEKAKKRGLQFGLLDTTELMFLRPDGHPNKYAHAVDRNKTVNDCVHWCLPGPIDTWNEFLLYFLKMEGQPLSGSMLQKPFEQH